LFSGVDDPPTPAIYTLSLHDALPISEYLPASEPDGLARVVFAHGFFASALHEIAHWCIAGDYRRTLHDYGYWYCPDGRTPVTIVDRKSTRLNSSHVKISYAVFCLKKK